MENTNTACLDEGLDPTCFESSNDIGGLWRFKEQPEPGRANIYHSVVLNSSKEMMSFSDFPSPADFPNNMHHSEVLLYLRLYTQAFKLLPHIHFQKTVVSVRQRPDFSVTGQWEIETEEKPGQRETHVFDAVIVGSGHFTKPHLPLHDFPGIERFDGKYFHSWEYRNADSLQGKRVVVIGIGNSGGDIAVDISRVAEKAFETKLNRTFNHSLYGLQPQHGFFAQIPLVNDELPGRIISGRVQMRPNVKEFCDSSVVFVDGSIIDKVDVVVFATGYHYSFPFLPRDLQAKSGHRLRLYRHVFPPGMSRPTLAVVGFIHALGAINPLAEMQARWATCVFKDLIALPTQDAMLQSIEKDTATMHQSFAVSERNPLQVAYLPYMDSLAEQIGVRPNILWLLLKDVRLGLQVLLGPCTPYQFRLSGPGQWVGACETILTQWERVAQPFKTRVSPVPEPSPDHKMRLMMALSGVAALFCFCLHAKSSFCSVPPPLLTWRAL
ncbi:unnamed protein product [Boreogadus saida]